MDVADGPATQLRVLSCDVDIDVVEEGIAEFRYFYRTRLRSDRALVKWEQAVSEGAGNVRFVHAQDADGTLTARVVPNGETATRIVIHLVPRPDGEEYRFSYGYRAPIQTVRLGHSGVRLLLHGFRFSAPMPQLRVRIVPPPGHVRVAARPVRGGPVAATLPPPAVDPDRGEQMAVVADAYRRRWVQGRLLRWLLGAIATGAVGALVAGALGWG